MHFIQGKSFHIPICLYWVVSLFLAVHYNYHSEGASSLLAFCWHGDCFACVHQKDPGVTVESVAEVAVEVGFGCDMIKLQKS